MTKLPSSPDLPALISHARGPSLDCWSTIAASSLTATVDGAL